MSESPDTYVRLTRPRMARLSGYAGTAYVLLTETACRLSEAPGASWDLTLVLYGPLFAYMGMRTIDAFSQWKNR